jgi:UDP-glucose 4-epimerase
MKTILITGGAGYIGSHIVEQLVNSNHNVIILDNLYTGFKSLVNSKAKFIKGDIKNIKILKKIIKENEIETIIHLAAFLNVSEAEKNKKKYYLNNIIGTSNLIKCCKNSNVKNFIFSSSCSIYGAVKGAVSEEKKPNPQGYYAFTKFKSEQLIKENSKKLNYKFAILRYFNVAGASPSGKIGEIQKSHGHLFKNIAIESLKNKPSINIFGNNYKTKDGTCIRDYIHVSDLADIHIKSIDFLNKKSKSFTINCGYGIGYSVLDIANLSKKYITKIKINFTKKRLGDVGQVYAKIEKLKKILKWKPKHNNIEHILKSSIKWEKKLSKLNKKL